MDADLSLRPRVAHLLHNERVKQFADFITNLAVGVLITVRFDDVGERLGLRQIWWAFLGLWMLDAAALVPLGQ